MKKKKLAGLLALGLTFVFDWVLLGVLEMYRQNWKEACGEIMLGPGGVVWVASGYGVVFGVAFFTSRCDRRDSVTWTLHAVSCGLLGLLNARVWTSSYVCLDEGKDTVVYTVFAMSACYAASTVLSGGNPFFWKETGSSETIVIRTWV